MDGEPYAPYAGAAAELNPWDFPLEIEVVLVKTSTEKTPGTSCPATQGGSRD